MYKISVPIFNVSITKETREKYLKQLKEAKVDRIFLCCYWPKVDEISSFKENIAYFKDNGIEPAIWYGSTIGHGGPLVCPNGDIISNRKSTLVNISGNPQYDTFCPLNDKFRKDISNSIASLANTGTSTIMLDDDFRINAHGAEVCCTCDKHMELIRKYCGEYISREKLKELAFTGKPNKYRDAFIKAQGDSLRLLATDIRRAVDKVNPDVRVTLCSSPTLWDVDGTSELELSKILAGKNQPEARLIGAPYWAAQGGRSFAYVVELERMLAHWNKDNGIETMSEGDAYPRPRHNVPASYLELFDGVMRADGQIGGILKYMVGYSTTHSYETGYLKKHIKNLPAMEHLGEIFAEKQAVGVFCPSRPRLINDADFNIGTMYERYTQPLAGMVMGSLTIPTTYSENGICTALFGEEARHIELHKIKKGAVLDAVSARILLERGIDVGLYGKQALQVANASMIISADKTEQVGTCRPSATFMISDIVEEAQVLAYAKVNGNDIPLLYRYENENGQKFAVLMADTMGKVFAADIYRHYIIQDAMIECVEWISDKKLPAVCSRNPDLYMICKQANGKMSVGLFNCFADSIIEPVITLDKPYKNIRFINCSGRIEGDTVYLDDQIYAFEFAAFEVS